MQSEQADSKRQNDFIEKIARYARVTDYHKSIKAELNRVMQLWQRDALSQGTLSAPINWRVATDSLPFLDRAHARLAGLGFVGKNTMLIRPGVGSYFFIAQVLIEAPIHLLAANNLSLPTASLAMSHLDCGTCTRCIDACPTSALTREQFLDSNRCLSFLTIEHRGTIADEFIPHLGKHFYGCDVCQDVCPYNLKTLPLQSIQPFNRYNTHFETLSMEEVARMNQLQYEKWFGGTAMTRAKYGGLIRNALYNMFANNDVALNEILDARKDDPQPLIAATVAHIFELNKRRYARDPR
jgi:epoxyqueuosine reductase